MPAAPVARRAPTKRRQAQRKVWTDGQTQLEYRSHDSDTLSGLLFVASKLANELTERRNRDQSVKWLLGFERRPANERTERRIHEPRVG